MARTEFKIIPDSEELSRIPRDLRFFPVSNEHPQTLRREDLEAFNRDGFLRPLRLFDEDEIRGIRSYFDELLSRTLAGGKDSYSISSAHLKHDRVFDILTHPRVAAYVKDLLGENVIGWGSHFFCKMPGDGKAVAWHQDAVYWPLTPSKTVTVWLAIDDADRENACMRFIAGSHRQGALPHRRSGAEEGNVLNLAFDDAEQLGPVVENTLRAGEASIHSDLLLHGSHANLSGRRRCGLTLRYCSAEVRAALDWSDKGVIVSGADPSGHWRNPPRPND